jgi:tetratricopeptide (TPR) repeat protein
MPSRAADEGQASVLAQAAALRSSGKRAGEEGQWGEAAELYSQACELLLLMGPAGAPAGNERTSGSRRGEPVAAELQKCRLSLSLCLGKQKRWRDVVEACSAIIDANARCGTAWFRRGQALAALGEAEAAVWDLRRASSLLPANDQVQRALARAQAARQERKPVPGSVGAGSPFGDLFGSGADGAGSSLGGLFGSGGGGAPGSGAGGAGGLLSLMSGMGGAKRAGQSEGLEALLDSPMLASMGGAGSGASVLIGFAKRALALRRRAKQFWLAIKPYLPLLFYLVLLLPTVLAVWQGRLKLWPF